MKLNVIFAENTAKREEVDDKQKRSEHRALRYTGGEGDWLGCKCFQLNQLSTARERWFDLSMRMVWEIVSRAALKLRRMRMASSSSDSLDGPCVDYAKSYDAVVFDVLKVTPEEFASQITLMDAPVFKMIHPEELASCGWNGKEKHSLAPNVVAFTRRFNQVSFWLVREILTAQTLKIRAEILSHFVKIAKKLLELNNLHSLVSVVSALQSAPIFRLSKTWALISRKDKATFEKLNYLTSKEENYTRMREYIRSLKMVPCIPYLGLHEVSACLRYNRRPTCPDASVGVHIPTPPPSHHRKSHSLGNNMMCQYGMSESRSATFPIDKARHLLDDSFLESQSPVRNDPHSTSVSNGLSLGSSESSFGEELSPGMERGRMYATLGPNWRVPLRNSPRSRSYVYSSSAANSCYGCSDASSVTIEGPLRRKTLLKEGRKPKLSSWTRFWITLTGSTLIFFGAKALRASERKHVSCLHKASTFESSSDTKMAKTRNLTQETCLKIKIFRVQLPPDSQEVQMQSFSSWIHSAEIQTNQQLGRQTKIWASKGFFSKK
ncbi:ras-specific guanine nucleotide-releasing factor RalGPS1 isoform X5 [Epinephelus fuscoguttatus]|uniref:ras-specific guanine nucleotide-releasing factor RalGPS1 isoform X5 n=1 Tax=Epinephelus fuscoguttatus TaxID=293821 RepID=UPI0020D198DE|nr:ras-specific guanine nucleotide-releasing factor RalGPS1 isoform X5 [Epinephelus fuscoguttatus]